MDAGFANLDSWRLWGEGGDRLLDSSRRWYGGNGLAVRWEVGGVEACAVQKSECCGAGKVGGSECARTGCHMRFGARTFDFVPGSSVPAYRLELSSEIIHTARCFRYSPERNQYGVGMTFDLISGSLVYLGPFPRSPTFVQCFGIDATPSD